MLRTPLAVLSQVSHSLPFWELLGPFSRDSSSPVTQSPLPPCCSPREPAAVGGRELRDPVQTPCYANCSLIWLHSVLFLPQPFASSSCPPVPLDTDLLFILLVLFFPSGTFWSLYLGPHSLPQAEWLYFLIVFSGCSWLPLPQLNSLTRVSTRPWDTAAI